MILEKYEARLVALKALVSAERKALAAMAARAALPAGSSRARVTTANARWATACEARDRALAEYEAK